MSKREIFATSYGEMLDMIACLAIDGGASQKKAKPSMETILFEID